jgi:hypothetical protein
VTKVEVRHAWLQKHPTPTNDNGDFHWHPSTTPSDLRNELTELAARAGSGASLWLIAPGAVAWARGFSEVAPVDGRRYSGLVLSYAVCPGLDVCAALASLSLPPARPHAGEATTGWLELREPADCTPVSPGRLGSLVGDASAIAQLAEVVVYGGTTVAAEPTHDTLPLLLAQLLTWLPPAARDRPRGGALTVDRDAARTDRGAGSRALLHYLAQAWTVSPAHDPALPHTAWGAARALAGALQLPLEVLFEQFAELGRSWDDAGELARLLQRSGLLTPAELAACAAARPAPLLAPHVVEAGWLWARLLHFWGRGLVAADLQAAVPLTERLAALLARRVVMDHLFSLDDPTDAARPRRYLRRLALESLLPRPRVREMLRALHVLIPTLVADPDVARIPEVSLA